MCRHDFFRSGLGTNDVTYNDVSNLDQTEWPVVEAEQTSLA